MTWAGQCGDLGGEARRPRWGGTTAWNWAARRPGVGSAAAWVGQCSGPGRGDSGDLGRAALGGGGGGVSGKH